MQLDKKTIKRIMKKYKNAFDILERYDQTRELPFQRKRIDITLPISKIKKLKSISQKTGKPVSRIIEEKI